MHVKVKYVLSTCNASQCCTILFLKRQHKARSYIVFSLVAYAMNRWHVELHLSVCMIFHYAQPQTKPCCVLWEVVALWVKEYVFYTSTSKIYILELLGRKCCVMVSMRWDTCQVNVRLRIYATLDMLGGFWVMQLLALAHIVSEGKPKMIV